LAPTIRSAEIERARRKRPESLDAYDLVMRALPSFWATTRESNIEAVALLERAMTMDPSYAFATALCAWCYAYRIIGVWTDDFTRERDTALRLAMRALSLDSEDPFVLAILGSAYYLGRQNLEAVPLIDKSLAIDPNSAFAWVRNGWLKIRFSDPDAAIACFERAIRISPFDQDNFNAIIGVGCAHLQREHFEQGALWLAKGIAARPSATFAWRFLVAAYVALDRMDEAREALTKFRVAHPDMTVSGVAQSTTLLTSAFHQFVLEGLRKAGLPE
jgi:adenylate cyclase